MCVFVVCCRIFTCNNYFHLSDDLASGRGREASSSVNYTVPVLDVQRWITHLQIVYVLRGRGHEPKPIIISQTIISRISNELRRK